MGHRGARKITELGPYHLSLSLSLAVSGLLSLHTSFSEMCVCVKERGGIKCVCACEGACPEQVKAGGLFGAIEIFQHVALAAGLKPIRRNAF